VGADENSLSSRGGHALKANSYHVSISGIVTWLMVVSSMNFSPINYYASSRLCVGDLGHFRVLGAYM
jgi:hypothetical protein